VLARIIPTTGVPGRCADVPDGIVVAPVAVSDKTNNPFLAGTVIEIVDAVSSPINDVEPPDGA
jgi:IMP cyclohydrolase